MNTTTISLRHGFHGRLGTVVSTLHHGLALIGLVALALLCFRGKALIVDEDASHSSTFGSIRFDGSVALLDRVDDADNPKYRALVSYLSRRYRVAPDATQQLVSVAYGAGQEVGLDPLLILAVMAIESRFNPIAESLVGAKGLMQVIPKHHQDKLMERGGEEAVLDPETNIFVGARILKDYIRRTGSLEAGLQFYNGSLADPSSQYAQKVIAEKERLQQAVRQYNRAVARSAI
jgi:Transglycosylase SLT domain